MTRRELLRTAASAAALSPALAAGSGRDLANAADPQRPRYHFLPAKNWMNDPNGLIYWKGEYHLFYQYNPGAAVWGDMHWGHAVSPDMVLWKHLPIAMAPTPGGYDKDGVFSGCAFVKDGQPTIMYTGVQPETQCVATTKDNFRTIDKYSGNPVIAGPPPGLKVTGFRDPCVWKEGADWMCTLGSGIAGVGGAVLLYRSPDLIHWQYLHPLLTGNDGATVKVWECPSFFPLGGKHVLLVSLDPLRKVSTQIGAYTNQKFEPETNGLLDEGGSLYAPQTFLDGKGRRILIGWLQETRKESAQVAAGWSGAQSIPRVLTLTNGRLAQSPIPEIATLRGKRQRFRKMALAPTPSVLSGADGDCLEIEATFTAGAGARVGLDVRTSPDGRERTRIGVDRDARRLTIDRTQSSLSPDPVKDIRTAQIPAFSGPLHMRVFLDHSVLEVFVNDETAMSTRISPTLPESTQVKVFSEGGHGDLLSADVWALNPAISS